MRRHDLRFGVGLVCLLAPMWLLADPWPSWRGPRGDGVSTERDVPTHWDTTKNIRWRISLPDRGNGTPVAWGRFLFVPQAIEQEQRRTLMCIDRATGQMLWQKGVTYTEKEATHSTNPYCSPSPVTDGERVIVWFGSAGLYCFDLAGHELWSAQLGKQQHVWGHGASPILHENLCILHFGPGPNAFVIALDKQSGKEIWRVPAPRFAQDQAKPSHPVGNQDPEIFWGSWATPMVVNADGRAELILAWPQQVVALDPKTGQEFWRCGGLADLVYCSPMFGDGIVVALGGYNGSGLAVKAGGSGDVTSTHRVWHEERSRLRLGTGIIHDGHIYVNDMNGAIDCIELKTNALKWRERPKATGKGDSWSSFVKAGQHLYAVNQAGDVFVFKANPEKYEQVARNSVGEYTNSTLVISDGEIFLRTHDSLWCIAEKKSD